MFKKIFAASIMVCALMLVSMTVFAATNTVTINSATAGVSETVLSDTLAEAPTISRSDLISIDVTISEANADITILVLDATVSLDDVDDTDIAYIDEITSNASGNVTFMFRMPLTAPQGSYVAYIGGKDVDTLGCKYLSIPEAASTFLSGDVDSNNKIESNDAIYILRHSIALPVPSTVTIEAGDVDGSGEIETNDAIYILRYSINLPIPTNVTVGQQISL